MTQYHPIPQLPCFSEVDASPFSSGYYYDGILSNDQTLNASYLEFESVDVAVFSAVSQYAMGSIDAVAHDTSLTGRSVSSKPTDRLISNATEVDSLVLDCDVVTQRASPTVLCLLTLHHSRHYHVMRVKNVSSILVTSAIANGKTTRHICRLYIKMP